MIDRNNLPYWLVEPPGIKFATGYIECAIKASTIDWSRPAEIPKEQQGVEIR